MAGKRKASLVLERITIWISLVSFRTRTGHAEKTSYVIGFIMA